MTNKSKNNLINLVLGLSVFSVAFFSVFGNVFEIYETGETDVVVNEEIINENPVIEKEVPATPTTKPVVTEKPPTSTVPPSTPSVPTEEGYLLADVKVHNSAATCWTAINGQVFDLTSWVNSHPGGKATILMICGKDGSGLYNSQHGRSNKVSRILDGFKIGILKS